MHLFASQRRGFAGVLFVVFGVLSGIALSGAAWATDLYVAPGGSDGSNCTAQLSPCQSISYAITQAVANDHINIAAGQYINPLAIPNTKDGLQLLGEDVNNKPQIKRISGGVDQPLLVIHGAKNVHVENIEFDMDQSFVGEGILAAGFVDGLTIANNHFVTSRSIAGTNSHYGVRNAISINDSANSQHLGRVDGSNVSITGNTIDGALDIPNGVLLRCGVDMDAGIGTISNNIITAGVHDIRVRFSGTTGSSSGTTTLIDNNTLNGRGLELDVPNGTAGPITISNNHINAIAGINDSSSYPADFSLVRLIGNHQNVPVAVSGNTFAGYEGSYRGVLVENFPGTTFTNNIFTPASNATDFVSLVVSNKELTSGIAPAPLEMSLTATGNTFNGSGVAGAGRAVEFLNDNDSAGTATFGSLIFGGTVSGETNSFDANLRWYFHLDDYSCETVGSPTCSFLDYAGDIGSDPATNTDVRPFTGNAHAADNTFNGLAPVDMNAMQMNALLAQTYDAHANSLLGMVDYSLSGIGSVVYVDAGYSGSYGAQLSFTSPAAVCGNGTAQTVYFGVNAFATISDGASHVQPGGTVCIAAGTFADNVVVAKPATIIGAGQGQTIVVPAIYNPDCSAGGGSGSLCSGGTVPASVLMLVQASDVDISGLSVDGINPGLSGHAADIAARNGIMTDISGGPFTNFKVHDATVQNIYLRGIYSVYGKFEFRNNTVTNVQSDVQSIGIFNFGGSGIIDGNQVSSAAAAIAANHSLGTTFTNNTITDSASGIHTDNNNDGAGGSADEIANNNVDCGVIDAYGIWTFVPYKDISIHDNQITGCAIGIGAFGGLFGSQPIATSTFTHNSIDGTGALISSAPGDSTAGAYLSTTTFGYGDTDNVVALTGNAITGFDQGIYLERTGGKSLTTTAHFNRIVGNGEGLFDDGGAGTTDFTNNWWGCNVGPHSAGCDSASGGGSTNPWLVMKASATPSTINSGDPSQILVDLTHNSNNAVVGSAFADGTVIALNASRGTLPASVASANGQALATLTGLTSGYSTVTTTLDNATVNFVVSVTVAATHVTVNDDTTGSNPDADATCPTPDFNTITAAINTVAAGTRILVCSGSYPENVVVNKSVTLYGPFRGTAGSNSSRTGTGEAVISPGSGYAVQVTADNVTFNGFTIKGVSGIAFLSGPNADGQVLNNRFVDSTGTGLYIANGSVASTGWLIQDNLFADLGSTSTNATAIILPNTDGAHLLNNVIRNVSYQGIQLSGATNIEIRGNEISAVQRDGINIAGSSNVIIADNTITDINQADLADRGAIRLYDSATGIEAVCNTIDAQRGGIALKAGTAGGLHLFDNKVIGNSVAGTRFIASDWSGGVDIGSNWYDGTPVVTGANASSVRLADVLAANPISNAACGNNTPTQIVAYAGTPQSTAINSAFSQPLVARVEDALGGAVMAAQTVTFSAPTSGASASLGTTSGSTDYNGVLSTTASASSLAGSYVVTATSGSFSTSGFALTNGKGTGTVTWDTVSFVYTGSNVTPTAHIAEEAGATCSFSPTSVGPNVGTYSVLATCESANYTATGTTNVSITPDTATLALSHLVQAYDGAPKSVLVTTTPAGVGYSVSYVGAGSTSYGPSTLAPTEVGTYTATASVDDVNYTGSNATGTLQIVQGSGDIALVVNGPIGPVHVGDFAQFSATMLANPALHQSEKFAYEVVLSKSNGTPLAVSDVTTMEVFYNNTWVDVTTFTGGTLPFTPDGNGNLVYTFPEGIPGYSDGFPITDASWTWNVRFTFATTGTYTGTWTLEDGTTHATISPLVTGSAAVVVQDALPPTDIQLVLGGPAENVQANTPVEYTGTMLADPSLHTGEKYFVRVTVAKSGGTHPLAASDLSAAEIYYGSTWQALPPGSFVPDGSGNLVYDFPQPADPSGFEIEDPEWTWNFRITYADTGTYSATAEVIHADEAAQPSPQVFASDAIATTVIPQVVVPPTMNLVLVGPVDDVAVGTPAEYTGTLLANPADFTGRTFWVRVRLSKDGGATQMTAADLDKMELYNGGGWTDATAAIKFVLVQDNNDLVYYFPQPNAAFSIDSAQWTWHFRFTYADVGAYSAQADVIDSTDMPLLNAASLAGAALSTNVVPHADITAQVLFDPASLHTVYDTNSHAAVVTTDPAMLAVDVTYNGSATLPTDAGAYDVVATITEPGYVGSANAVLVIDKAPSTVTIDSADLAQVFGATFPVDASASPISTGGHVDVTYDGSATVPTNIGIYTVVATLVDPNYTGSASATLSIAAPSLPNLAIQITDGRDYVQYGKLLTYRITVSNIGNVDVTGASVSVPLPVTVLGAQPGWSCVPVGMATCGSGGNGALSDSANIPVGGGVVYLLNVWANNDPGLTTDEILMQASVTFMGDVDTSNNTATDLTTMVIFRDGFEEGGDGAQTGILTTNAIGSGGIDARQLQLLDLTGAWSSNGDVVRVAHLVAGRADMLDVQAIHIGDELLVRLAGVANGRQMVGAWSSVPAGTSTLAVSLASVGTHSMLILAGASQDLTVQLSDSAVSMTVIGVQPAKH